MSNDTILDTICQAFASPTRLRILGMLAAKPVEARVLRKTLTLSASSLSQHMKKLIEASCVTPQSNGKFLTYKAAEFIPDLVRAVSAAMKGAIHAAEERAARTAMIHDEDCYRAE